MSELRNKLDLPNELHALDLLHSALAVLRAFCEETKSDYPEMQSIIAMAQCLATLEME